MVSRFAERGDEVDILTSDAKDLWYFNDRRRARLDAPPIEAVDGARVVRFPVRHQPLQRYTGKLLARVPHWPTQCRRDSFMPLIPDLEGHDGDYDLVCAVGFPFTLFAYSAWKLARRNVAPLVLTPFLHLSTPGDPVNRHYTRPHQIRLLKEADLVVVVTGLEADVVAGWGVPRERILINPMGYEPGDVTGGDGPRMRERLGIPADRLVIGHLATLDPNKGTNDLVRAVARLNERRGEQSYVQLVLGGVSSPHFESFATSLPASASDWLTRTGPIPTEQKADFFAMLDLFSMPSRTDSFGIVFLEAWANGVPVVAARAGGVVEVVEDGRTGVLVEFGDVGALSLALRRLLEDRSERQRLGQAGRAKVAAGFRWSDCFDRLDDRLAAMSGDSLGPSAPRLVKRRADRNVSV